MARVNINILGISELKWTGMGEFNSGDHYIYYCGQDTSEGMKWLCQSGNDTQWWLYLLVREKANDVKNNIHRNLEC